MEIDKEGIKQEANNCSNKVQSIVDRHIKLSITEHKFRNILQIVLKDGLKDRDIEDIIYFETFASAYECSDSIEECKKDLLKLLNSYDWRK